MSRSGMSSMLWKTNLRHGQQLCQVNACWWGFLYPKYRGIIPLLVNELTTFVKSRRNQSFLHFADMRPVLGVTSPSEGQSPAHTCSFSGLVTPEDVNHLFVDCTACRQILPAALLTASPETVSSAGSLPPEVLDWSAPQSTETQLNSGSRRKKTEQHCGSPSCLSGLRASRCCALRPWILRSYNQIRSPSSQSP